MISSLLPQLNICSSPVFQSLVSSEGSPDSEPNLPIVLSPSSHLVDQSIPSSVSAAQRWQQLRALDPRLGKCLVLER
jgi:hypothetical protein